MVKTPKPDKETRDVTIKGMPSYRAHVLEGLLSAGFNNNGAINGRTLADIVDELALEVFGELHVRRERSAYDEEQKPLQRKEKIDNGPWPS